MNKLSCPRCDSAFFTASRDSHLPCPYCGFVLKAHDTDRRSGERTSTQRICDILKGEVRVPVKTVDVSATGLGVKMMGYLPFEKDEAVSVLVKDLDIARKARVVWTKKFYGISRAGLRFSEAGGEGEA
ncbi:MAG: PilZ domain-containing protein [Thermodesulfobacteriota bacterium]